MALSEERKKVGLKNGKKERWPSVRKEIKMVLRKEKIKEGLKLGKKEGFKEGKIERWPYPFFFPLSYHP